MSLASNLRLRREDAELTREQLAVSAGVTGSTVARIETGDYWPRMATLAKIADALGCQVADLVATADAEKSA